MAAGREHLAVEAAKASEAVKLHGGLTYDGHAKTGPVLPIPRSAPAAPGAARAGAGAAADKDGWAMRQEQEVNRAVERYADTVGGCAWSI